MKRTISIVLVVVLIMGLAVAAFAETGNSDNKREKMTLQEKIAFLQEKIEKLSKAQAINEDRSAIKELRETLKSQMNQINEKRKLLHEIKKEARQNKDFDTLKSLLELRKSSIELDIERMQVNSDIADVEIAMLDAKKAKDTEAMKKAIQDLIAALKSKIEINNKTIEVLDSYLS